MLLKEAFKVDLWPNKGEAALGQTRGGSQPGRGSLLMAPLAGLHILW